MSPLVRNTRRWLAPMVGGLLVLALTSCADSATSGKSNAQLASIELNAGLAAQIGGKADEATSHYHKVLQYDPHNKFAFYNLGLLDQQAGRMDSAEKNYRSALATDPNMSEALYNLAIVRTKVAPTEAVDLYIKLIALNPNNTNWAAAHLNLGFLYQSLGKPDQAQAEWKIAIAQDPNMASRIPGASPKP